MSRFRQPIRVFIVAAPMLRWGLEKLVSDAFSGIRVVGSARTLRAALEAARNEQVDVLVVDADDDENQQEHVLAQACGSFPLLLLTGSDVASALSQGEGSGTVRAVRITAAPSEVLQAIRDVRALWWAHRRPASTASLSLPETDVEAERIASLTSRERQLIFVLMCNSGASGKVVADRLSIAERTLRNHLTSIYSKLGVHSRLGLHAYAARHELDLTTQEPPEPGVSSQAQRVRSHEQGGRSREQGSRSREQGGTPRRELRSAHEHPSGEKLGSGRSGPSDDG